MSVAALETPQFESRGETAREAAEAYLTDITYSSAASTQRLVTTDILNSLIPFVEDAGIVYRADIGPRVLSQWLASLKLRGLAPTTIRKRYESARGFFNWCVRQEYVESSPVAKLTPPKNPPGKRQGFTQEQVRRLIRAAAEAPSVAGIRDRAILTVLLGTGARADELLKMQFRCIDKQSRRLVLHGKGDKDRIVPLGLTALRAINDWLQVRRQVDTDRIWTTQRDGPMSYATLNAVMRSLERKTGIPDVQPHRFRHTFAAEHYRQHRDIIALQGLLGHSRIETTQTYLRTLGITYALEANYSMPDEFLLEGGDDE